jgi:hypothetical protein
MYQMLQIDMSFSDSYIVLLAYEFNDKNRGGNAR